MKSQEQQRKWKEIAQIQGWTHKPREKNLTSYNHQLLIDVQNWKVIQLYNLYVTKVQTNTSHNLVKRWKTIVEFHKYTLQGQKCTPYEKLEKDMMFISNNHNLWHVVITTMLTIGFDSKLSNKLQIHHPSFM